MKICTNCGVSKSLLDFYTGAAKCKPCVILIIGLRNKTPEGRAKRKSWITGENGKLSVKKYSQYLSRCGLIISF